MKLLSNLPIALKLLLAILLLAVIATAIAVGSILELRSLNAVTQKLAHDDAQSLYLAATANERMTRAHQLTIELILANEPNEIGAVEQRIDTETRELKATMGKLRPFMDGAEQERTFAEATTALDGYLGLAAPIRAAARTNDDAKAQALLRAIAPAFTRVDDLMHRLVDQQSRDLLTAAAWAEARFWVVVQTMIGVTAVGLLSALGLTLAMIRFQVTGPLRAMTELMQALAGGDLGRAVVGLDRRDEIGAMARSVEVFKGNAVEIKRLEDERIELARRAEEERRTVLTGLAGGFEASVKQVVDTVVDAASRMQATATSLADAVRETTGRTTAADAAAADAADNVGTVFMATEELRTSIEEIARRADDSRRIAHEATRQADETSALVSQLDAASERIGGVVELIGKIAGQTNLLALNATIEAARAGEAGKGFAVVASEVKNLANQTARATDEIAAQVGDAQAVARRTGEAITAIAGTIRRIEEIAGAIASAVDEQSASTREIGHNAGQAAQGTTAVSDNLHVIRETAKTASGGVDHVLGETGSLTERAGQLRQEVDAFLAQIRRSA